MHGFVGMVNAHVLNEVEKGYRLPRPQNCPVEIYDMMKKCWEKDPDRRPTFEFLYTYFEDYFVSSQDSYQGDQNGIWLLYVTNRIDGVTCSNLPRVSRYFSNLISKKIEMISTPVARSSSTLPVVVEVILNFSKLRRK